MSDGIPTKAEVAEAHIAALRAKARWLTMRARRVHLGKRLPVNSILDLEPGNYAGAPGFSEHDRIRRVLLKRAEAARERAFAIEAGLSARAAKPTTSS